MKRASKRCSRPSRTETTERIENRSKIWWFLRICEYALQDWFDHDADNGDDTLRYHKNDSQPQRAQLPQGHVRSSSFSFSVAENFSRHLIFISNLDCAESEVRFSVTVWNRTKRLLARVLQPRAKVSNSELFSSTRVSRSWHILTESFDRTSQIGIWRFVTMFASPLSMISIFRVMLSINNIRFNELERSRASRSTYVTFVLPGQS